MATDWSFLGANPELVAALKSYEARRAQATIAPTSIPQIAGEAADEQGFLADTWDVTKDYADYGIKKAQTALEAAKYYTSSQLGKAIDPEAYERALIANAGEPLEDIDTQERIINAPGALGTLVEKFIPGEQEGWAKAGKTVATLAAEILGDPLTYVPVGGAGGMLYRGAKGIKTATKLAGAGKLAKAAKVGGMGTIRALASPAAGLAYAPDILAGVSGGAQEAWQEASEGNVSNALAAATQAGVVGILGGLLGKGAYGDVKGLRAARKALGTKGDPVQGVGTSEMDALRTEAKQILPPEIDIETMSRPDLEAALNQQKSIDADNAAKALAAQETEVAPEAFPDDIEGFEPNLPQSLDAEGNPIEILPEEAPANTVDKWVDEQGAPFVNDPGNLGPEIIKVLQNADNSLMTFAERSTLEAALAEPGNITATFARLRDSKIPEIQEILERARAQEAAQPVKYNPKTLALISELEEIRPTTDYQKQGLTAAVDALREVDTHERSGGRRSTADSKKVNQILRRLKQADPESTTFDALIEKTGGWPDVIEGWKQSILSVDEWEANKPWVPKDVEAAQLAKVKARLEAEAPLVEPIVPEAEVIPKEAVVEPEVEPVKEPEIPVVTLRVEGKDHVVELTPEQKIQWDTVEEAYQRSLRYAKQFHPEYEAKQKKAAGFQRAAARREITGILTRKEQAAADKKAAQFETGKEVTIATTHALAGRKGKILRTLPYGRAEVDIAGQKHIINYKDLEKLKLEPTADTKFQTKEVPITKTEDVGEVGDALGPVEVEAYHGTQADIDKIDFDQTQLGMHFGTVEQANRASGLEILSPKEATYRQGQNILPVSIKLKNPLRLPDLGNWGIEDTWKAIRDAGINLVLPPIRGGTDSYKSLRDQLQKLGYDGIVYKNKYEISPVDKLRRVAGEEPAFGQKDSYIVFDRKQVTSTLSPKHKFALKEKIPQFRSPEDLVKAAPKEMGGDWTVKDGEASATLGNGGKLIVKAVGQVSLDSDYKGQHGALPDGTKPAGSTQTVGLDTIIKLGPLADIGTLRHELKGHAAFALRLLDEDTQGVILKKYGSEEAFAQAVQTGKFEAPKGFWNKVKEAFTRLYRTLVGSQDGKATQKILDAYRAMPAEFKQAQRKNLPAQTPALTEYKARDFIDPPHDPTLKPIPELKLPEKKKAVPIPVEKLKAKPEVSQAAKEAFEKTPTGEEKPKPDKKTSLNFETELEKLDIKGEDKQRFVAEMKALNSSMDRSKTQHMSEADMDMIMTNKFGEATPEFIRQRLETNEWDQADLRYFKRVLATARIDKINKHVKSANDPSNKGLKDAYEEAGVREEILALAVGNGKTYAGRLLRSLRTSDTALTPDHSFFDRFIQGLREEGLTERRIEFIKEAREEKGISFAMDVASKVANPGLLEKFVEWRTLGFLTGPATILAVNPLSNAFMRGMKDWEHAVLNVFHETKALITGKEPESYASEIGATLRSHVRTLFNKTGDMSTFGRGFMEIVTAKELSDRSVIFPGTKRSSKIEQRTRGWIGHTGSKPARIAGEYFKYGAKFLEVVDELAKSFAGNDARARLTHRKAKRSLREELKAGTRKKITAEDILQREIEFGKEIDDARQGILNEIERVDNYNKKLVRDVEGNIPPREKYDLDPKNWKNLGLKSQWGISTLKEMQTAADTDTFQLRMEKFGQGLENVKNSHPSIQLVVPFFRTPVNIVKEAIKRTPVVGVLFKSPGTSRQEAWVQTTTGALAASITLIVASGGSDDYFEVTGGGPQNARKNSNLRATGWQPYSFRVGDRYYDYSRLEPISSTIGIAADMYEAHKEGDLTTVKDKRNKMFASVQENFLNKTFLMGLEGLFGALEQPERRLDAYLRNFVGSVVPVGVKAFTRAYDPVIRKKESLVGDALKATLPGFSETLEPYRDSSGAPVKRIQPLNPIYTSTRKKTAVADVLREFDRIGYIPMSPRRANTKGIRLSNVQFAKLSDVRQSTLKEIGERLLKSPKYMNLPPERRKDILKKYISNREYRIKKALFMQAARGQ